MFSSNTSQVSSGGYEIQRSLRFNSADSANLTRTFGSINSRTFTYSLWIKRGRIGTRQDVLGGALSFYASDVLGVGYVSGSDILNTTQVFRDPSAWYHIVMAMDTTQATASNRLKLYVNGQQVTVFSLANYPAQNSTTDLSTNGLIGYGPYGSSQYFDGYMTEVNFIDGQALTPSSFGAFDAQTGVWGPTPYAGSYGTNGFYLNFSDNSNTTAATLGKDYSGNSNNWTPNNFSVSAGAGNDSLVDVPTNWGTDTGVGGSVRGNYATLNPIIPATVTVTNGNLDVTASSDNNTYATLETGATGKWYAEFTITANSFWPWVGTRKADSVLGGNGSSFYPGIGTGGEVGYLNSGSKYIAGNSSAYGATFTTGDIIGIAVDCDNGATYFSKNGVFQNSGVPTSGASKTGAANTWTGGSQSFFIGVAVNTGATVNCNFGQRPFAYTAPSGFKALNTQNLPTPTIGATSTTLATKYFNPVLYTGTGASLSVTGVGFQPDLVWGKSRSAATNNNLYDAVRGTGKILVSNNTDAEVDVGSLGLSAFNSDGFSLGAGSTLNNSGSTYVAWNWKANGAGVTNTAGSITSTVSANTTSGFSVVTWTGNGVNASIGHGLGAAPKMVITKNRDNTWNWFTYHEGAGASYYLELNTTAARNLDTAVWQNTAPTSSVFTIGSGINANGAKFVAYAFAEVPGYSKFGSYTGNGSADGPFVFCGFRPAYVMIKGTTAGATDTFWIIFDSKRNTYNLVDSYLAANNADAEGQNPTVASIDMLSNGFKVRSSNTSFGTNQPNNVYVFAAFAEAPQKFSLAR